MKFPALLVLGALLTAGPALLLPQAQTAQAAQNAIRKGKVRVAASAAAQRAAEAEAAAAAPAPAVALSEAELAVARKVHTGDIPCAVGTPVAISADSAHEGYFFVRAGGKSYYMRPVLSSTGATRLEDTKAGAMWLQLGNKSMLLDQTLGRRVADECAGPAQLEFAARMKNTPQKSLLGPQ